MKEIKLGKIRIFIVNVQSEGPAQGLRDYKGTGFFYTFGKYVTLTMLLK